MSDFTLESRVVDVYGVKSTRLASRLIRDLVRAGFMPHVLFSVDWRCRTMVAIESRQTPRAVYVKVGGPLSGVVQWTLDPRVFSSGLKRASISALGKHLSGDLNKPMQLRYTPTPPEK
jgi:hypothetical protein